MYRRFDDIIIRKILQVKDYKLISIDSSPATFFRIQTYNEPYFFYNFSMICIGYNVNTIDGDITLPVIGMRHIRKKENIKDELLKYIPKFHKRRKDKIHSLLIKHLNLPIEIIYKIMKYY